MSEIANLTGKAALDKVRQIAEDQIALFCTSTPDGLLETRPMATQGIDDDGRIWFFSAVDSRKNQQITAGSPVHVFYALPSRSEYLALNGTAAVSKDQRKIDELWSRYVKTWFNEGKDDPRLSLIEFSPSSGHYWDTKSNRTVQLAKIALGALTGKTTDDSVEGSLKL